MNLHNILHTIRELFIPVSSLHIYCYMRYHSITALAFIFLCLGCNKNQITTPKPDQRTTIDSPATTTPPEYYLSIDSDTLPIDGVIFAARPTRTFKWSAAQSESLMIFSNIDLVGKTGSFNVVTTDSYDYPTVKLADNELFVHYEHYTQYHKVYTNRKHQQNGVVTIHDLGGTPEITINNLWLFNEQDIEDSIKVTGVVRAADAPYLTNTNYQVDTATVYPILYEDSYVSWYAWWLASNDTIKGYFGLSLFPVMDSIYQFGSYGNAGEVGLDLMNVPGTAAGGITYQSWRCQGCNASLSIVPDGYKIHFENISVVDIWDATKTKIVSGNFLLPTVVF